MLWLNKLRRYLLNLQELDEWVKFWGSSVISVKKKEAIEFLWEKIWQREILSNIQAINQGHKQY